MNFISSHFERIIGEFAVNIEYVIKEHEKYRYVSNNRFTNLEKRVSILEGSTNIVQNNEVKTNVDQSVSKGKNLKPDDLVIRIDDNSRNVLLKSPETINDDTWVHVDNIIKEI